jgi:nicotinate-nucleotide pyrophosphorylase (carboxylating)
MRTKFLNSNCIIMQIMDAPLFLQNYPRGSQSFNDLVNLQVKNALIEDIGPGDLTASLVSDQQTTATIVSREKAIICGIDWVNACFQQLDNQAQMNWHIQEGQQVSENQVLCDVMGNARSLLSAERCALNFLQTLSAVATHTHQYVQLIQGTKAKILDTRKTIPGLRLAQKYAVTVGGGFNQRIALYDGILIKENHIAAAGSIAAALKQAFALNTNATIQIEVESLAELNEALVAGATSILLDNFSLDDMQTAVRVTNNQALLEASGNVNLSTVRQIAETGVDRISVGALTKNIQAIDLSMRIK